MKAFKLLSLAAAVAGFSTTAFAQFDGPTPLAWRWSPPDVEFSPTGAPTISNNVVYVAAKSRIFALDANSGNEKWKFPLDGAKGTFRQQPVVAGDTVMDVTDSGYIYAASVTDGTPKWTYEVHNYAILGQPAVVGDLLLFEQSDDTINALSIDKGEPAWDKPLHIETGFNGPLLPHESDVIFADNNNQMFCVNAVTQKINWKRQFGFLPPELQPTIFDDNIYLYSGEYLVCLNAVRGFGKWQVNLGQSMEYGPAVSLSGILCVSEDGNPFFFDLNGHRMAREVVPLGSGPTAQPSAVGTKFLIPTNNGALNLLDPTSGQTLWSYAVRPIGGLPQKASAAPTFNGMDLIDPRILTIPAAGPAVLNGTTMLIMCDDASLLAFDPKLGVDLTPPDVDMLWPKPGAQLPGNPPLDLVFQVSDEATGVNVKTLKIDVDGTPLHYIVGRDGVALVHLSQDGPDKGLNDGRRTFNVTVSDWAGNVTKKSFSVIVDNSLPPLNMPPGLHGNGQTGRGKGTGIGAGG